MDENILNPFENDSILSEDVQKKLSNVLEKYQQLSDEEKEEFKKGAFDILLKTLKKLPNDTILPMWLAPYQSYILFIFAISIVVLLLVIFTRKLYRREWEREHRQEEKKKRKEQKLAMKKKLKKT